MKHSIKKYTRIFGVVLSSILLMGFKGDIEKSKTYSEAVTVSAATHLKVKNNCGSIEFKNTSGTEARFEASVLVEGESEAEIKKVFDQFQLMVTESGGTIDVVAEDNVKSWVQSKSWFVDKNTITFKDGTEAKDIEKIEVSFVVYLPEIGNLSIYNRYDKVSYDKFNFDVDAELFSSDFIGGDINGDLDLDNKYGEINIGNIQDGDFNLFDCDSKVKNVKDLNLNVKYSDLEFQDVENCDMNSFDDVVKFGNISNNMDIDAKYSEIFAGSFDEADLEFFDCEAKAGNGNKLTLDSKYSEFKLGDIKSVNLELFDDVLTVGNVIDLDGRNTKYSEIDIDKLEGSFKVLASFQDNYNIKIVGPSVKSIELEGKYTDLYLPIPADVSYFLDADLRYSTLIFPDECKKGKQDNGDQSYDIDCEVRDPNENSLKVKLNVFDGDINIK